MGWCSGTSVFDSVMDVLLGSNYTLEDVVEALCDALWDSDWDCEGDSKYYDEFLLPIMKRRGYIDEDDD